ncbi:hypothetical protein ACFWNI_33650 [Streptomyces sp. NPDC058377]|uniref:hypothetical protein n=1 Tax=Streptomyces sp. NPDC058377 TaxID=3346468 RepID=UPI00365E9030
MTISTEIKASGMNMRHITAASQVILAAQKRGTTLAAPLAMALEAQQMLRLPSAADDPEKDTAAPAGATSIPGTILVAVARALREQPTGAQLLEGLDELGELSVCDGEPAEIASWVAALCHLVHLDNIPAAPTVVYRAEHDAIVAGLYTTAEAAQQHCEALVSREYPASAAVVFEWCVDEDDVDRPGLELDVRVDGEHVSTGYTVTPLEVAAAYDPDADE